MTSAFTALASLKTFPAGPKTPAPKTPTTEESCDFCHAALAERHQHLFEPVVRKVECVCDACAILFSGDGRTKYRRVPRRVRYLPDFRMTDAQWDALTIPIGLAFFSRRSATGRMTALYPSPGGPIESELALESWNEIVEENPAVRDLESDVEGLLVNRIGQAREHFLVPVDVCFTLVGIIRMRWKGLSGGPSVWSEVNSFLNTLKE